MIDKTFNEALSFEDINTVIIESSNADIEVNATSQQAGRVSLTTGIDKNKMFHAEKKDHQLTMSLTSLNDYPYSTLTLNIPNSVKSITIKTNAGDVLFNHMKLDEMTVYTVSGDISLKKGVVKQAFIQTVNGNVDSSSAIKNLQIKTVSGDIHVKAIDNEPFFDLHAVSGDIMISTPATMTAQVSLKSVLGEVIGYLIPRRF